MAEEHGEAHTQLPRPQSWYQQWPFDARLTFQDSAGKHWRYMVTPTDERYLIEPVGPCAPGSLPPEELEVRDHLLALAKLRRRVGVWGMVRALLLRSPNADVIAAQTMMIRTRQLCFQGRAYRAALLRLGHAPSMPPGMRKQLLSMVHGVDEALQKYGR